MAESPKIGSGGLQVGDGGSVVRFDPVAMSNLMRGEQGPIVRHFINVLDLVVTEAKREAPVGTPDPLGRAREFPVGNLRDRIVKRISTTAAGVQGTVGPESVTYALWAHEGTVPHGIDPVRGPWLVFAYVPGQPIFARHVNHPGNEPNRFLIRAAIRVIGPGNVTQR